MESKHPQVLKRNSEFLELKKIGRRHWPSNWLLLNYRITAPVPATGQRTGQTEDGETGLRRSGGNPSREAVRFGVTASRKVGSSIVRNRLKRWCREYFRSLNKKDLGFEAEINVVFKPIDQGFYKGLSHGEFVRVLDRGVETLRKHAPLAGVAADGGVPHGRDDVHGR